MTLKGTVGAAVGTTFTTLATVTLPSGITELDDSNNTASDSDPVSRSLVYSVSGQVFADTNHNGQLDATERGTGVSGLYAKIVAQGNTRAAQAVAVDLTTGNFSFSNIAAGSYTVIIDTNNRLDDTTPGLPTGWLLTTSAGAELAVEVASSSISGLTMGLYHGSKLEGGVFNDSGVGGGTAGDGILNGTEKGLPHVTVRATSGDVVYVTTSTAVDGTYTLWLPGTIHGQQVQIT